MDTIAQSFASLVKSNSGFFKSEAQAKFLMDQCVMNEYTTCGSVHGNSFNMHYAVDAQGVELVTKYTKSKGYEVLWQRKVEGRVSIQDEKEIKRLIRLIKGYEKSIANRQLAMDDGKYDAPQYVFDQSMAYDKADLLLIKEKLAAFSSNQ